MATTLTSDERAVNGARTQSLFRDANEKVQDINEAVPLGDWVCECADESCVERIALTLAEYEIVREDPRRFAISPGDDHVVPEIEAVVARTERFWVVEMIGKAGELAAKVDPRRVGLHGQWHISPAQEI